MSIESYPSPNGVLTSLIWRKTMSGAETSLSGYDNASQALSYTPGQEQVYLNGILLVRGDDYTATNGTSITGLAALSASDFIQINCYNNFSVASTPSTSIVGAIANNQLANSAITINGSAISLGGSVTLAGDIESVTAGTGLSGGGASGAVTLTNSMATAIDAKGDLVVGTAADAFSRLAVGADATILVADSTASTGLKWATPAASTPTFVGVAAYINGTASSFTQNVQATLSFPAEEYDSNSFHDNSTNNSRLTIPTGYGGKYLVTSVILTPDDWNGYGYGYLFKNGAAMNLPSGLYNDGRFGSLNLTPGVSQLVGSSTFALAQGDYIEMRIQSAWTTGSHAIYARFTATWLGA